MIQLNTQGADRFRLPTERVEDQATLKALRASGALVADDRRRRPFYFDGRFLTARDLTRDQHYVLTRQADLGRAAGAGVVAGLHVGAAASDNQTGSAIHIEAGHGVTPSGELVFLQQDLLIRPNEVPDIEQLNVWMGLSRIPEPSGRSRTGVYILALRPVEYTANPIASYPTSITAQRTVEDGEVIEAVAVTLIPFGEAGASEHAQRAQLARAVFVYNRPVGMPVDVLPLAVVGINRGELEWVDAPLVRREIGADARDILGLGFAPRALREAHLIQYDRQMLAYAAERQNRGQSLRFAAAEVVQALPPGGRLPAAAVSPTDFTQCFFPPQIEVDLALVPEDEAAVLVEESLLLPPIDLASGAEALEAIGVVILLPVARTQYTHFAKRVRADATPSSGDGASADGSSAPQLRLRSTAAELLTRRRPLELLSGLRLARPALFPTPAEDESTQQQAWREALAAPGLEWLWYVRRRNVAYAASATGAPVNLGPHDKSPVVTPVEPLIEPPVEPPVEPPIGPPPVFVSEEFRTAIAGSEHEALWEGMPWGLNADQWRKLEEAHLGDGVSPTNDPHAGLLVPLLAREYSLQDGTVDDARFDELMSHFTRNPAVVKFAETKPFLLQPEWRTQLAQSGRTLEFASKVEEFAGSNLRMLRTSATRAADDPLAIQSVIERVLGGGF